MIDKAHPLRPLFVEQREVLISQARLYRRWRGAAKMPAEARELFGELETAVALAIRAIEGRVDIARPWSGD